MLGNPYESKKDTRRRVLSDILILLVALGFLWGIYHVFFVSRYQVRAYTFADAVATADSEEGNASFAALMDFGAGLGEDATLTDDLAPAYPLPAALLAQEAPYTEDAPYFRFDGKRLVLAQTVLTETTDERALEIFAADVATEVKDGLLTVTLSDFRACAFRYNARTDQVSYQPYDPAACHVAWETLTVAPGGKATLEEAVARVKTNELAAKADTLLYDEAAKNSCKAASVKNHLLTYKGNAKSNAGVTLTIGGGDFVQYGTLTLTFRTKADTADITFTANRK